MSQLLKKFALLTACAVLALCFATRPASAQMVSYGGTGEHLLFAYWSAENYMNTNVNIHSPVGVRVSGETKNVVRVVIRDGMGDAAADFKICLTPGDSWGATLSMGNLMVMDPGECDGEVEQVASDRTNQPLPTPMMGEMASLGGAMSGYLEAWLAPSGGLVDDAVSCVAPATPATPVAGECAAASGVGGGDADLAADNATPRNISGAAMLVSATSGFSSSYNAVALMGCGDPETALADASAVNNTMIMMANDDGDGCWTVNRDAAAGESQGAEGDGAPIQMALMNQGTDLLTGRWTAIKDENIMSHTKVVLTFPVNHLNYEGENADGEDIEGTDPVTLLAFDDMGQIVLDNRAVMLDMNVNMCKFGMDMMDDGMDMMDDDHDHMDDDHDHMDDGMDMMDDDMMMAMLSCNGMDVGELTAMSGEFRIFNNVMDAQGNDPTTTADESDTFVISDGTEADEDDLGIKNEAAGSTTNAAMAAGGQVPDEALAAIGLNLTYFMGTDGMEYDQATPLQWVDVTVTDVAAGSTPTDVNDL